MTFYARSQPRTELLSVQRRYSSPIGNKIAAQVRVPKYRLALVNHESWIHALAPVAGES